MIKFFMLILGICVCLSLSAQSQYYFDAGLGLGWGTTSFKSDGFDLVKKTDLENEADSHTGMLMSVKVGYEVYPNLFATIEWGSISDNYNDIDTDFGKKYIQFSSHLIGPGLVYYPLENLQIAGTAGYGWSIFDTNEPEVREYFDDLDNGSGFAYNLSAAYDFSLGKTKMSGLLFGVNWFQSLTTATQDMYWEKDKWKQNSSMFSIFLKYRIKGKLEQKGYF